MSDRFWNHLTLKDGDVAKFVPQPPSGDRLGGITESERSAIGTALQSVPDTYRTAAQQDAIHDDTKIDKADGYGLISDTDKEQISTNKNDIYALQNADLTATAGQVWTATDSGADWEDAAGGGWVLAGEVTLTEQATSIVIEDVPKDASELLIRFNLIKADTNSIYVWFCTQQDDNKKMTGSSHNTFMRLGLTATNQYIAGDCHTYIDRDYQFSSCNYVMQSTAVSSTSIATTNQGWGNTEAVTAFKKYGVVGVTCSDGFSADSYISVRYKK